MRMRNFTAVCLLSTVGIATPAFSQDATQWIIDKMNPACSDESRQALADQIRQQIEDAVRRAEAAILPPGSIGDLSCLNDLMDAPLDIFSNIGGILGSLQGGLSGAISGVGDDITRQVCQFAADQWEELSEPLTQSLSELTGATSSFSDLWSNFDLSGNGSTPTNTTSSNPTPNVVTPGQLDPRTDPGSEFPDTYNDPDPNVCSTLEASLGYCTLTPIVVNPTTTTAPTTTTTTPTVGTATTSGTSTIWNNLTGVP